MKEEPKNEMDLLLRRLARRDDAAVPDADHLDADELSGYAENALPAAARSRYTSHLAECSRCRGLVVQLSSAAGVVVETDNAKVAKPSAWRTFLAGLFTPVVLRYAAPALGLIIVAAIGFVVLRRQHESAKFVTQVTNNEQRPTALPSSEPYFSYDSNASTNSASKAESINEKQAAAKQSPVAAGPPNAPPTASSVEADAPKDQAAKAKPEQETTATNEPPPPKVEPTATPEERQKSADAEATKKEVREMPATAPAPAAQSTLQAEEREDRKTHGFTRAPKATDEVSGGIANVGSAAKLKRDELSANTRSVAGRRFQKKGGVWIDTAYDSSKDSVTLTRGSEQYRALVADEPAIKTIADELDGEIIVVWKGHTYRIR
jgi:hypothetical protein